MWFGYVELTVWDVRDVLGRVQFGGWAKAFDFVFGGEVVKEIRDGFGGDCEEVVHANADQTYKMSTTLLKTSQL